MQPQFSSQIGQRVQAMADTRAAQQGSPRSVQPLTRREATGSAAGVMADVDGQFLVECLMPVLAAGCGVTFSATSDGGALSVTLLCACGRFRDYCVNTAQLNDTLAGLRAHAQGHMSAPTRASVKRAQ